MSSLTVRYFASLRERLGLACEEVEVPPEGASLGDLLALLVAVHGEGALAALTGPGIRIAVNDELLDGEPDHLKSGDLVAFLPPVTGG